MNNQINYNMYISLSSLAQNVVRYSLQKLVNASDGLATFLIIYIKHIKLAVTLISD